MRIERNRCCCCMSRNGGSCSIYSSTVVWARPAIRSSVCSSICGCCHASCACFHFIIHSSKAIASSFNDRQGLVVFFLGDRAGQFSRRSCPLTLFVGRMCDRRESSLSYSVFCIALRRFARLCLVFGFRITASSVWDRVC